MSSDSGTAASLPETLVIGELRLRVLKPTHRCVVPTLEHGRLAKAPHALRTLTAENRVAGPGDSAATADERTRLYAGGVMAAILPWAIPIVAILIVVAILIALSAHFNHD